MRLRWSRACYLFYMSRVPFAELIFQYARSSGPGGQNVNKVNSKCLLKWDVVNSSSISDEVRARFLACFKNRISVDGVLVLSSDQFRDQKRNQADCIEKLEAMLAEVAKPPKKRRKTKPTYSSRKKNQESKRRHSDKKRQRNQGGWD